jgi:hypothetical protein
MMEYTILNDESYSVEERLEMAKVLLEMKDKEIQRLSRKLNDEKSMKDWIQDQSGYNRMGL